MLKFQLRPDASQVFLSKLQLLTRQGKWWIACHDSLAIADAGMRLFSFRC